MAATGHLVVTNNSTNTGNYTGPGLMDTNVTNTQSMEELLDLYNSEVLIYLMPAIVYTAIMMILGLPGNMMVFYIYFAKWRQSTSRIFILSIAVLDMVNCATTLPMEIYIMRYSVKLDRPLLCKVTRFSTYSLNSASAIVLCGIAIDRFMHICRPHSRSFSPQSSLYVCIGSIAFAVASTWPSLVLYGTRTLNLGHVTGYACLIENQFDTTLYPMFYLSIIFLITMLLFVVLAVFYCMIGYKIYRHRKSKQKKCTHLRTQLSNDELDTGSHYKIADNDANDQAKHGVTLANSQEKSDRTNSTDDSDGMRITVNKLADGNSNDTKEGQDLVNGDHASSEPIGNRNNDRDSRKPLVVNCNRKDKAITTVSKQDSGSDLASRPSSKPKRTVSVEDSLPRRQDSTKGNGTKSSIRYLLSRGASTMRRSEKNKCTKCVTVRIGRSTLMLFLITIAYILSFVPFYVIVILRQSDKTFGQGLSKGASMAYHLFLRSYLLSSAINPFIYSFCNEQFREYLKDIILHDILRRPHSPAMLKLKRRF